VPWTHRKEWIVLTGGARSSPHRFPRRRALPRHDVKGRPGASLTWLREHHAQILAAFAAASLAAGGLLHLLGAGTAGDAVWGAAVAVLSADLAFEVGRSVIVQRSLGVDAIALVAMVGALALGQELADHRHERTKRRAATGERRTRHARPQRLVQRRKAV
jgi:hypothetical protein